VPQNKRDKIEITDPKTLAERQRVAEDFAKQFKIKLPILVDTMDDQMNKKYFAWPDRLYVIDAMGKLAYVGAPGPRGFKVQELPPVLDKLLK
jgi:hypothetical protein